MGIKNKFKTGAASFYVVAFSTLILVIIASSFASAIIMEIARSSNEDLSQSAYDAALAGVEDAKVAFANYRNCIESGNFSNVTAPTSGAAVTCTDIVYWMEHADKDSCDVVARILGRIGKDESWGSGVAIEETGGVSGGGENNMNQAYTCTTIQMYLDDYRADLSSSTPYKVVKVNLKNVEADKIKAVKLSWYSNSSERMFDYTNMVSDGTKDRVAFQSLNLTSAPTPPTLGFQLIQTAEGFSLSQLNSKTIDGKTDRAMLYLVPTNASNLAAKTHTGSEDGATYIGAYDSARGKNIVAAADFANTNNHSKNYPYAVYCPEGSSDEYACSTVINLPSPIGGKRNKDTFMFVVSIPYGQPATDFSLELLCGDNNEVCDTIAASTDDGEEPGNIARLKNMQLLIDSTGRANDLYRRVEIRMESANNVMNYPIYAIQLDGNEPFSKDMKVTKEYGSSSYPSYTNW